MGDCPKAHRRRVLPAPTYHRQHILRTILGLFWYLMEREKLSRTFSGFIRISCGQRCGQRCGEPVYARIRVAYRSTAKKRGQRGKLDVDRIRSIPPPYVYKKGSQILRGCVKTRTQRNTDTGEPKLARGLKGLTLEEGAALVVIKPSTRVMQDGGK